MKIAVIYNYTIIACTLFTAVTNMWYVFFFADTGVVHLSGFLIPDDEEPDFDESFSGSEDDGMIYIWYTGDTTTFTY